MRILTVSLLWVALTCAAVADFRIDVRATEAHGVFYLLECLRGDAHRSQHLPRVFREGGWTRADEAALSGYVTVVQDSPWTTLRLPGDGEKWRKLSDVLEGLSLEASDPEDFLRRARPVLSTEHHRELCRAVRHFAPLYRSRVWQPCLEGLQRQKAELTLELEKRQAPVRLRQAAALYASTWPPEEPFVVALTPIPRKEGEKITSYGHSDGYLEVVEAPQGAPVARSAGVIFHELCHSLWSNRTPERAAQLRQAFLANQGGAGAYDQLNEGLATALGNGWFDSLISGSPPSDSWYNDPIIDAYARALYPLVLSYLERSRPLDEEFAVAAVGAFERTFPRADSDVLVVMRNVLFVSEDESIHRGGFQQRMARIGPMRSLYAAAPLSRPESLERFQATENATVVFLVRSDQLGMLGPYGWTSREVELARQAAREPLALCRRTPRGWSILAIGRDLPEQEAALRKLIDARWLSDSFR
ncbi:MAG: hypothetical protein AB1758_00635 [Candidatus Eremiobacterota bacterium]